MATRVYEEKEFTLQDGTDIVVRPLPIKPLRKFMARWEEMNDLGTEAKEADLIDIMFDCAYIVVKTFNDDVTEGQLEDSLDMKTMEQVLSVGGGITTGAEGDPKLTA